MKPKGRPKGPEMVVYKRRVLPEVAIALDSIVAASRGQEKPPVGTSVPSGGESGLKAKGSLFEGISESIKDRIRKDEFRANPFVNDLCNRDEGFGLKDLEELKRSNMLLLDDIQRLTDELGEARMELEEARMATENEKTQYWIARALRAERAREDDFEPNHLG
jgi:hypothetical protein